MQCILWVSYVRSGEGLLSICAVRVVVGCCTDCDGGGMIPYHVLLLMCAFVLVVKEDL
jgi:hypothetical protein